MLITDLRFELVEDHHSQGSGRYGVRVILPNDISVAFPYLNTVLEDTWYDHENRILIGTGNQRRCAFRPNEIQVAVVADLSKVSHVVAEVVDLVNRVWEQREQITPSFSRSRLPGVYGLFQLLPRTNCKQCGYPSCLAFAAELRKDEELLKQCPLLWQEEGRINREQIVALFSSD